jgi:hypothetical protein
VVTPYHPFDQHRIVEGGGHAKKRISPIVIQ